MHIAYLDGRRLRLGLIAGSRLVRESARYLDSINVFPVPDGDTGTNMAATVLSIERRCRGFFSRNARETLRNAANAALSGSRGNSGAILSQFFHGLAEEVGTETRLGVRAFAAAVLKAADRTWDSVSNPREGTILTVCRDWARSLKEKAETCEDFLPVWTHALEVARLSLKQTMELLPEAKKAGVVDAGASGFVRYLEGVDAFIFKGSMRSLEEAQGSTAIQFVEEDNHLISSLEDSGDSLYRFCVEAMLENPAGALDTKNVKTAVENLGDSLVIAGGGSMMKVHIHSDNPPEVFSTLAKFGSFSTMKVDDMNMQKHLGVQDQKCVIVVDSSADLPDELRTELMIPRVPVRLIIEGEERLDRDAILASDVSDMLKANPDLSTSTSQPTHGDYTRIFSQVTAHSDELIYLGLSSAVSGTFEAGKRAGEEVAAQTEKIFRAVDTKTGTIGIALIARRCAQAAAAGASGEDVVGLAEKLRSRLHIHFAVRDLHRFIRSGRLSRLTGLALTRLGIRPLLTVSDEGQIVKSGVFLNPKRGMRVLEKALFKSAVKDGLPEDIAVTHVGVPEKAKQLAETLEARFNLSRSIIVVDLSPAISAHMGAGSMGISWITSEEGMDK